MSDVIEKLGRSLIQHGKSNDRIYLMKLDLEDLSEIIEKIEKLAKTEDYSKIFAKIPTSATNIFAQAGYHQEALIPNFFKGRQDVSFMSRFLKPERSKLSQKQQEAIKLVLKVAQEKKTHSTTSPQKNYHIRPLKEKDTTQLASLYKTVFPSYPFPIFDQNYLLKTMSEHIRYFGAFDGNLLVAASSAETDSDARNAEMTDFATNPDYRKKGLASELLKTMELHMKSANFTTLYTIARATSIGINTTFARSGYIFGGTLYNNTQISGNIESMNVWCKNITQSAKYSP